MQLFDSVGKIGVAAKPVKTWHAIVGYVRQYQAEHGGRPPSLNTQRKASMVSLKTLLDRLHVNTGHSDVKDIKWAIELIIEVQSMTPAERDCLRASYVHGPLFDGDVPSKCARSDLVKRGYMEKVVVKGEDGYNACTHQGAWAYRLIELGA